MMAESAAPATENAPPGAPPHPDVTSALSLSQGGPGLVHARLIALKRRVTPLSKDHDFEVRGSVRYRYRGIDDLYDHLHHLMGEVGLLLVPGEVLEVKRAAYETPPKFQNGPPGRANHVALVQRYHWIAEDGSSLAVDLPGEGMDAGDKATGKALSMAHKYALVQSLNLPVGEPDGDAFFTEGAPAPVSVNHPGGADGDESPVSGGTYAPRPTGGGRERVPFESLEQGKSAITEATEADLPALRRRVLDSVNASSIRGNEANELMGLIEQRQKGVM